MVVRKINCLISVLLIVLSSFLGLIAVIFAYIDNLFSVPIIFIAIALILLLLSVQIFQATKYKKPVFLIINLSVLLVFGVVFLASIPIRRENDKKLWEERNKIVSQIESGELNPECGIVYLDESSVNEQISDSCRVILAMDGHIGMLRSPEIRAGSIITSRMAPLSPGGSRSMARNIILMQMASCGEAGLLKTGLLFPHK